MSTWRIEIAPAKHPTENTMLRTLSLLAGICLASATLVPLSASAASLPLSPSISAADSSITHVHSGRWSGDRGWRQERHYRQDRHVRYCERLRRACVYKHERGETGEGNCRRYRSECGR